MSLKANNHFYIDGLPPEEYAALWGDGKTEAGCLFYNFSSESLIRDKDWLNKFCLSIYTLTSMVQNSHLYLQSDLDNLDKLKKYVLFLFRMKNILVIKDSIRKYDGYRKGDKLKVTSTSYSASSKSLIFRLEKGNNDFGAFLCHKFDEQFVKFSGFEGVIL